MIIDRHVFIAIYSFNLILVFLLQEEERPSRPSSRRPFKISCNTDLLVTNSFSFLMSGKFFISSSILKENDSFAGYHLKVVLVVDPCFISL